MTTRLIPPTILAPAVNLEKGQGGEVVPEGQEEGGVAVEAVAAEVVPN